MSKKKNAPMTDAQVAAKKAAKSAYDRARREALGKLSMKAVAAADQENAKKRDQRAKSKDGAAPSERAIAATAKAPKAKKPAKATKTRRLSALDAAAEVLATARVPLRAKDLIERMSAQGLWTSPGGKTPDATLYAAMVREINAKGPAARFRKMERGVFIATARTGKGA